MRFSVLVPSLSLAIVSLSAQAFAEDMTVETKVHAATVYAGSATITRTASIDIPEGNTTLVINALPANLFPDSLRAEGSARAKVTLGAIESKQVSSAEISAPRQKEIKAQLEALDDRKKTIESANSTLADKIAFLQTLGQQASLRSREDIAAIDLKPDQWMAAANTIAGGIEEAKQLRLANEVLLRDLQREMNALQNELNQLGQGNRATYQIRIPLESTSDTTLKLSLSYQLPEATWRPVYDARLDTQTGKLTLVQYGEVQQKTGEDWKDVKLTLSTAQPARGTALPPLYTEWVDINRYQAPTVSNFGSAQLSASPSMKAMRSMEVQDTAEMGRGVAGNMPAPEQEATFQNAVINTGGFVGSYDIPGANDVLADGSARKVMIQGLHVNSDLVVQIKPQISTEAFLVATTKLVGDLPLLPGQASLFRDGAFIGTTELPLLRPGEETEFGFGIDDQIAVKYNVMKDERGESGVIARDSTRTRQTRATIQNLHNDPVKIAVLQTVPVPRSERIVLAINNKETTSGYEEDVNNIKGQLRWNLTLAPQQKEDLSLGWMLSWPRAEIITGSGF